MFGKNKSNRIDKKTENEEDYKRRYEEIKAEMNNKNNNKKDTKKLDRITNSIRTIFVLSAIGSALFFGDKYNIYNNLKNYYTDTKNKIEYALNENIQKRGDSFLSTLNENYIKNLSLDKNCLNISDRTYLTNVVDSLLDYLKPEEKRKIFSEELDRNYEVYRYIIKSSIFENIKESSEAYFISEKMIPHLDQEGIESIIYSCINHRFGNKSTSIVDEMNSFYYKYEYKKPTKKQIDWGGEQNE